MESWGIFAGLNSLLQPCSSELAPNYVSDIQRDLEEVDVPLLNSEGFVQELNTNAVNSERAHAPPRSGSGVVRGESQLELETLATPPVELSAILPMDHQPGRMVRLMGPHGPIEVEPPASAEPGFKMRFKLAPRPEFRIEVPPNYNGSAVRLQRSDGVEISVRVPPGLNPGDKFEVTPPALMVRVPEGARAGDFAVFRHTVGVSRDGTEQTEWIRAKVPPGVKPGAYFAARMPIPPEEDHGGFPGIGAL
mmetsp:Transcript_77449/g.166015  ORF Transcript_77449/g.166015 Transcript_77449/m.166015 type:complete len:249 (-) Transcript_77449:108-854(-)